MRLTRTLKITLAAIALVVMVVVTLLWLVGRTSFVREKVAALVSEATGLPATVEAVSIGLWRGPSFELHGLALAQPTGFGQKPLVEVGTLRIMVPFGSLWGDPVAHSVIVEEAVLRPAVAADGSDNWSRPIEQLTAGDEPLPAWSVGRFELRKSAVEFHDAVTDLQFRLTAITIVASDVSEAADFPLDVELGGVSGTNTFLLALEGRALANTATGRFAATGLNVRGWMGGEPLPLAGVELTGKVKTISFDGEADVAAIDGGQFNLAGIPGGISGSLYLGETDDRTLFAFRTEPFAPRAPAIAFGMPLPRTTDQTAFGSFQISVEGHMRAGMLHLDPIEGRLDETEFSGLVVPDERLIRVTADRIEVDRYLAPDGKRRQDKKATLEAAIAELAEFDIDAEIRIAEAQVAGARLRDTVIRVERTDETAK